MTDNLATAQLRSVVERIEALETQKRELADDIRGVYAEAKSNGFDPKALRALVRRRRMAAADRAAFDSLLETYEGSLGG